MLRIVTGEGDVNSISSDHDGNRFVCDFYPLETNEEGTIGIVIETRNHKITISSQIFSNIGSHIYSLVDDFIEIYTRKHEEWDEEKFIEKIRRLKEVVDKI